MMRRAATFEEHGEVLGHWWASGVRQASVVCLDRHLDFKRISSRGLQQIREHAAGSHDVATLNRDIPFRDDDAFPYGLDSFVGAAGALGVLRRFVWVRPSSASGGSDAAADALWTLLSLVPGHGSQILESFATSDAGARACIGGLEIVATDLDHLDRVPDLQEARLDIDLDYVCEPDGRLTTCPDRLARSLLARGLAEIPPTLTYSVSSGFTPKELCGLGPDLLERLGFAPDHRSGRSHRPWRALDAIARHRPLDEDEVDEIWRDELAQIEGGAGHSARALLELQRGDRHAACAGFERARTAGDRAGWVAYALGLDALAGERTAEALGWFDELRAEPVDTIEAHARLLRAICVRKLDGPAAAIPVLRQLVRELPLLEDACTLGLEACEETRDAEAQELFENHARHLRLARHRRV